MSKKIRVGYILRSLDDLEKLKYCDVVLALPKNKLQINLKTELKGNSNRLLELARLSTKIEGLLMIYADTDNYGLFHKSIISLRRGKLISLCDKTVAKPGEKPAFGFKMCEVNEAKCGVLVGEDVLELNGIQSFSNLQCDVILNVLEKDLKIRIESAIETLSYIYGINIISLTESGFFASDKSGKIIAKHGDYGEIILEVGHQYYESINKKRGI
ncbi:MAG: hypothetical protein ACI4M6_00110 [Christensenellaceae bacterium]